MKPNDPTWRFDRRDQEALAISVFAELTKEMAELRQSIDEFNLEIRAFERTHAPVAYPS